MKILFPSHYSIPGKGIVLYLLLAFLFSACSTSGNETPSRAISHSSCTTFSTRSTGQGVDAAILANLPLPGHPFKAIATSNGQWIFVSIDSDNTASNGIAVLHQTGARICLQRVIMLAETPLGLALTHDDSLLLMADWTNVTFVDTARAESGAQGTISGSVLERNNSLAIEVVLSQDERSAFVANENDGTVGVINMRRVQTHNFGSDALVDLIPVNKGPLNVDSGAVGMAVSPDNRYLYVTSRIDTGDPSSQGNTCHGYPPGTLSVVDIARAEQNPAHAVLTHAFAGCGPVRVILSPTDDIAWVAVQGDNVITAFSTTRLRSDSTHAQLATINAGEAPTGETLVDNGAILVVANSNRFYQPQAPQTLTVFDTRQALQSKPSTLATIDVGAFPRELTLEAHGHILLLTNFNSNTVSIIDVAKLSQPA